MNNNASAQTVKSICQIRRDVLRFNALIPNASHCNYDVNICGHGSTGFKLVNWMPDELNLSDVKQIHQTDGGSTLDTTGAGCKAGAEAVVLTLMGVVMVLPKLWVHVNTTSVTTLIFIWYPRSHENLKHLDIRDLSSSFWDLRDSENFELND
ncbi:Glypican-5 [Galemys pyrenaicus]|uniref:Glypican-5 n=1 Tax=Galemys pyrenaicus TaxID=202257 RepID=A0A8J6AEF3_GALPY|nr:Glypican-5 [Galemys pyrenaicus]